MCQHRNDKVLYAVVSHMVYAARQGQARFYHLASGLADQLASLQHAVRHHAFVIAAFHFDNNVCRVAE